MTRSTRRIAHDVNNELLIIRGFVELAARDLDSGEPAREYLERIEHAAQAIAGLIRELQGASERAETESAPNRPGGDATILVVDDSETMRRLVTHALDAAGFEVFAADGADQALERLAGEDVDLLLADVQMPGTSGPELAARARDLKPGLPIVFVTGDGEGAIEFDGGTAPALGKPFVASELVRAVEIALGPRP